MVLPFQFLFICLDLRVCSALLVEGSSVSDDFKNDFQKRKVLYDGVQCGDIPDEAGGGGGLVLGGSLRAS